MRAVTSRRDFLKQGAGFGAGLALANAGCSTVGQQAKTDYFFEIIDTRRSVRQYKPTPVPEEHILKILNAAKMAPTAGNRQPWKFLVMQDAEKIKELKEEAVSSRLKRSIGDEKLSEEEVASRRKEIEERQAGIFSAPVYIGVLTDSEARFSQMNSHDGPLAAGYLCLAARALGYGTVYLTGSIPGDVFRKVANIPERYDVTCVIPLGIPEVWPEPPEKKPLEDMLVHNSF